MSDPLIVDGDGHTMEPDDLWTQRMDRSRWGDWIPRKVIEDEYYETVYAGGTIRGQTPEGPGPQGGGLTPQQGNAPQGGAPQGPPQGGAPEGAPPAP